MFQYQTERDGVLETRVEKKFLLSSDNEDVDQNMVTLFNDHIIIIEDLVIRDHSNKYEPVQSESRWSHAKQPASVSIISLLVFKWISPSVNQLVQPVNQSVSQLVQSVSQSVSQLVGQLVSLLVI